MYFWAMTLLSILVIIIALPLCIGTVAVLAFGRPPKTRKSIPAVLFHSVCRSSACGLSHITPETWRCLCERLHEEDITTVTVAEAARRGEAAGGTETASAILTFDDGFDDFMTQVFPVLSAYEMRVSLFAVAGFLGKPSTWDVNGSQAHLNPDQIREISHAGHEIGSHTLTHPNLCFLSEKDLRTELLDSKKMLEDIIRRPVAE